MWESVHLNFVDLGSLLLGPEKNPLKTRDARGRGCGGYQDRGFLVWQVQRERGGGVRRGALVRAQGTGVYLVPFVVYPYTSIVVGVRYSLPVCTHISIR